MGFFWRIIPVLFVFVPHTAAFAEGPVDEVRLGVLAQSCCGYSPDNEQGVGINLEVLFASPKFLSVIGAPRPVIGGTAATDSDGTSKIYAGLEWRYDWRRAFVSGALGGAIHNGETKFDPIADAGRGDNTLFFGCRALFHIGADIGYKLTDRLSASLHWAHISNASICTPNNGLDQLGLRLGMRF